MLYYLAALILTPYFYLYHRLSCSGRKNIPDRPCIFASNHASYLDPPLVAYAAIPRQLRFIAWDKLFTVPVFSSLIRAFGAVPVSHENKNSSAALLRMVIGFLKSGHSAFICPEGTRTTTGELMPLEGGVALLAIKTGAPIVPTWCGGTYRAFPPHGKFPKPKKVYVVFGEPIWMEDFEEGISDKEKMALILEKISNFYKKMDAIDKEKYGR